MATLKKNLPPFVWDFFNIFNRRPGSMPRSPSFVTPLRGARYDLTRDVKNLSYATGWKESEAV